MTTPYDRDRVSVSHDGAELAAADRDGRSE